MIAPVACVATKWSATAWVNVAMRYDHHVVTSVLGTTAWFGLYPTSSVLNAEETKLYLGMRQYVLEIDLSTNAMRFLIPARDFVHQLSKEQHESIRRQYAD